jgi:hypothetical protein
MITDELIFETAAEAQTSVDPTQAQAGSREACGGNSP